MKRSEMFKLIQNIIVETMSSKQIASSDVTQRILNTIEKNGMLPPINYPYSCNCPMISMCPKCQPNEYKMYNVWESEDV